MPRVLRSEQGDVRGPPSTYRQGEAAGRRTTPRSDLETLGL